MKEQVKNYNVIEFSQRKPSEYILNDKYIRKSMDINKRAEKTVTSLINLSDRKKGANLLVPTAQ